MTENIDRMYAQVAAAEDTPTRIGVFQRYGYDLPDIDNYNTNPGGDPDFEKGWHRWLHLFNLSTGVERASVMAIAFELHRSNPPNELLYGTGFFCHGFTNQTRDMYYAKAMCLAYRQPTYAMNIED